MGLENRLIQALRGQPTDRPPFWFMRQAGRYLPEYRKLRAQAGSFLDLCFSPELASEVTLQPVRRYDMDAAILFADILLIPHALGQGLEYREGEGPVLEPVRSPDDLARLDRRRLHEVLAPVYETVSKVSAALDSGKTALIGFAGAPWTVATYMVEGRGSKDYYNTKLWAFGDEAGFGALIALLEEVTVDYLCRQIEAGAQVVQIFDSWAGVLPQDAFERWCIAPVARMVAALKARHPQVPIIGFPRGAGALYAPFTAQTGVDAASLDTTVPWDWARENIQSQCAVQGNLDPLLVVVGGKAMRAAARRIIKTFAGRPFVFNLGHGLMPQTPPKHVAELAALIRGERG